MHEIKRSLFFRFFMQRICLECNPEDGKDKKGERRRGIGWI